MLFFFDILIYNIKVMVYLTSKEQKTKTKLKASSFSLLFKCRSTKTHT